MSDNKNRGVVWVKERGVIPCALGLVAALGAPSLSHAEDCSQRHTLFSPRPDACLEDIVTDRPHKTDTPAILDPGHAQAEIGVLEYGYAPHAADEVTVWNTELKLGITPRLDLEMFYAPISTPTNEPASLSRDLALRAKIQVASLADGAFLLTLVPYVELSHGDLAGAGGSVFLGYDFASGLELELNVGDVVAIDGGLHTLVVTSALTQPLVGDVAGFVEWFSETTLESSARGSTLDVGLLYVVTRDVQIDAGVYLGLYGQVPLATPFLGTSFRL